MDAGKLYEENIKLRLKNEYLIKENLRLLERQRDCLEEDLTRNAQYNLIKELISGGILEMKEVENVGNLKMYLVEINSPYKFRLYDCGDNDLITLIKKLKNSN